MLSPEYCLWLSYLQPSPLQVFDYADEVAAELKQSLLNLEKTNASLSGSLAGSFDAEDL